MDSAAERAAREARIKHLIERLDASYPQQTEAVTTILLDITTDSFVEWLQQKSHLVRKRKFPVAGGYLMLQEARRPKQQDGDTRDPIMVTIDGLRYEGGATFLQYKQIFFTVYHLAAGGIAIQAKCNQPAVAPFYAELLSQLAQI